MSNKQRPVLKLNKPATLPMPAKKAARPAAGKGTPYQGNKPKEGGAAAPRSDDGNPPFRTERFARRDDTAGSTPYRANAVKSSQPRTPAPAAAPVVRSDFNEDGLRSSYHRDFKTALQTSYQADVKPDSLAFALLGAASAVVRAEKIGQKV